MVWWVDGWVNGWGHVKSLKNRINLDLIEIIQFCLKIYEIYDLWRQPTYGWVDGVGQWVWSGQITKN